jgi:aminoglycoside 6'-N-acetyltransferase
MTRISKRAGADSACGSAANKDFVDRMEFVMETYSFRRVTAADLAMIRRWLETPAVREWWVDAEGQPSSPIEEEDLTDQNVAMWIVSYLGDPFAFIQDYDPHAWDGHHFGHLPPGSRGIDQFIGEPHMLGRGHGSAFIRAHVDLLMAGGAPAVGTDPHPSNARAIRAYEKAGFARCKERATEWGYCLLMERHASREG